MKKSDDQLQSIPPYCPNSECRFHFGSTSRFYVKNGWVSTQKAPFKNQRYKCKKCGVQFSENTFSLDFRKKLGGLSEPTLYYSMNGMSNNSIARRLDVAEGTVRDRLKCMARQSLLFEKEMFPKELAEDVAYDGFETFTHSQFSPCYINTAVGSRSHYIYHNTFSPLNRKGRMTHEQKMKNIELIKKHGIYPRDSVFEESCYIMKSLSNMARGVTLFTDEHKSYMRAYHSFDCKLEYETISSRERRTSSNPLFPINRLHNLYRHFLSSQQRETIAFQKHEAALLEKMQLMKIFLNFMNPKFVRKNKFDRYAHEWSPAMYLGLTDRVLSFNEIFGMRKSAKQVLLDEKERLFLNRQYPFSRQKIAP